MPNLLFFIYSIYLSSFFTIYSNIKSPFQPDSILSPHHDRSLMNSTDLLLLYVPMPDELQAKELAKSIIEQKLAACINIIPRLCSVYRWENTIETEDEAVMLCKTTDQAMPALIRYLEANHPYDCPALIQIKPTTCNEAFASWATHQINP